MRRRVGRAAQRLGPARSLKPREPADAGGYQRRSTLRELLRASDSRRPKLNNHADQRTPRLASES